MDLITHVTSITEMVEEAISIQSDEGSTLAKYFTVEGGSVSFNVAKVPVNYSSGGSSVCLVRGISRAAIESSESIKVLGQCINGQYVFDSDADRETYESIYDTKPRMIDDGEGGTIECTPPYMIGVFA